MGHNDDSVAHWFCDEWRAHWIGEGQADTTLATDWVSRTRRSGIDGIVDLLAIRKNHQKPKPPFKRGDIFEIILIQIKGGGAKRPNKSEIKRLRDVAKDYNARAVVLAEWVKGKPCQFYWLIKRHAEPERAWGPVDPGAAFR